MAPRKKLQYENEVAPKLREEFGVRNWFALPRFEKIVLNVGVGKEMEGPRPKPHVRDQVIKDLSAITGQRPVIVRARKAVSNFRVRRGFESHAKVTLRRDRMWEFFDRLISLAIPRIKDFRGLPTNSFDGQGNYSFGVGEQGIFPEVNMAEAQYIHGMNFNFILRNSDPAKSRFLLQELGVPFRREQAGPTRR